MLFCIAEPVQVSFQFTDGNQSHIGNGTITIVIVPRQLNFTGTAHLVYQQDVDKVPISMLVLNVWTNVVRSEVSISVISAPMSGVIRNNFSSEEIGDFHQTDIDNGLLFYCPTNVSASQDTFTITLESGKQRIDQIIKVTVMTRLQLQSVTLTSSPDTLSFLLPANLFHIPDSNPALDPHITVTTSPRYGTLSKRSRVERRQLLEVVTFSYRELQGEQVEYIFDESLQNGTDYVVKEEFETLVQMTSTGQPGRLTVSYSVKVPRKVPPTETTLPQDPFGTGDTEGTANNTLIVVPVMGVLVVVVVVVGTVCGALLVRCYRLRERDRRRREKKKDEAQQSNRKSEASRLPPSAHYITPEGEDNSSGGTINIGDDVTARDKQFLPMQNRCIGSGLRHGATEVSCVPPVCPHTGGENGVDNSDLPPYSQQPVPVPLPEKPSPDVTSMYSQRGFPQRSPVLRAVPNKKFGLTYNTSAVHSDVKKLFRSDYPQLKHVEYWV